MRCKSAEVVVHVLHIALLHSDLAKDVEDLMEGETNNSFKWLDLFLGTWRLLHDGISFIFREKGDLEGPPPADTGSVRAHVVSGSVPS